MNTNTTTSRLQILAVILIVVGAMIQFLLQGMNQNAAALGVSPSVAAWAGLVLGAASVGIMAVLNYLPSPKQESVIAAKDADLRVADAERKLAQTRLQLTGAWGAAGKVAPTADEARADVASEDATIARKDSFP